MKRALSLSTIPVAKRSRVPRPIPASRAAIRKALLGVAETKHYEVTTVSVFNSIGTGWTETLMSYIAAGAAENQRVGSKIAITGFKINGLIESAWTTNVGGDAFNCLRYVVYLSNAGYLIGGATPLVSNSLNVNTSLRTDTASVVLQPFRDRYIAMKPSYGLYNGASGTAGGPALMEFTDFVKFKKPLEIEYNSSSAAAGNKGLWIGFISDSSAMPNPGFIMGYMTTYYKDV